MTTFCGVSAASRSAVFDHTGADVTRRVADCYRSGANEPAIGSTAAAEQFDRRLEGPVLLDRRTCSVRRNRVAAGSLARYLVLPSGGHRARCRARRSADLLPVQGFLSLTGSTETALFEYDLSTTREETR